MKKQLTIAFLATLAITTGSFSIMLSTSSNYEQENSTTSFNPSDSKILQFSRDNQSSSTYGFWNDLINTQQKNAFSDYFIQPYKNLYQDSTNTGTSLPGYNSFTNPTNLVGSNSRVGSAIGNGLDLEWYSPQAIDPSGDIQPGINTEYNHTNIAEEGETADYQPVSGARSDLFGMNFGLNGNFNYSLGTKDNSGTSGNESLSYNYNLSINNNTIFSPDISSSSSGSTPPGYYRNQTESTNYKNSNKDDFSTFQLWNNGLPEDANNNPETNIQNGDNPYPSSYSTGSTPQVDLIGNNVSTVVDDTGSVRSPENYYAFQYDNITYNLFCFIIPNGNTDSIITEYTDSDNPDQIHLNVDSIYTYTVEDPSSNDPNTGRIFMNNGDNFARQMFPSWPRSDSSALPMLWYDYLNYGAFINSAPNDIETYQAVRTRKLYTATNQSDSVRSMLNYGTYDDTGDTSYRDWNYHKLGTDSNSATDVSLENFQSPFANRTIEELPTTTPDWLSNPTSKFNYAFLTLRSRARNSHFSYEKPRNNANSFNAFTPYNYYTAIVGGRLDPSDNSRYYTNSINANVVVSSINSGSAINNISTYSYNNNSVLSNSSYSGQGNIGNRITNQLPGFASTSTVSNFPSYAIVLIVLGSIASIGLVLFFIYREYRFRKWLKINSHGKNTDSELKMNSSKPVFKFFSKKNGKK